MKAKSNRVENLPDVLPLLIATQAGVAKNGEVLFAALCKKYAGDEELLAVADMFHTVSGPLQAALPPSEPTVFIHVPESPTNAASQRKSPMARLAKKLSDAEGQISESGPKLDAALSAGVSVVAHKAGDAARRVSSILKFSSSKSTPASETPPPSPSSGKTPGKPGSGA